MFTRLTTLLPIAALVSVAAAAPSLLGGPSQCTAGSTQCCSNTYASNDPTLTNFFSLIGAQLPNVSGLIGAGCTPITGIGASSGGQCATQPVCCAGNTLNGLLNVGCTPISGSA